MHTCHETPVVAHLSCSHRQLGWPTLVHVVIFGRGFVGTDVLMRVAACDALHCLFVCRTVRARAYTMHTKPHEGCIHHAGVDLALLKKATWFGSSLQCERVDTCLE